MSDDSIEKLRVLIVAHNMDGTDVGEALIAYEWAKHLFLSNRVVITILTQRRTNRLPLSQQLPEIEVVEWDDPFVSFGFERLIAILKPSYHLFALRVKKWIKNSKKMGRQFDVIHQLTPFGVRFGPINLNTDVPYVYGPTGGGLETPASFVSEQRSDPWFMQLRKLDRLRFKLDPFWIRSFRKLDLLIGVGDYILDRVGEGTARAFVLQSEHGFDVARPPRADVGRNKELRLIHVGRGIRTKALYDTIKAIGILKERSWIKLVSVGVGDEIDFCRAEVERMGLSDRVSFLGKLSHDKVLSEMRASDMLVFPSYREPSGAVVYEAMSVGIPVLAANYGGPAGYVDETCGVKVEVLTPDQFANDIATAIAELDDDRDRLRNLAKGGYEKILATELWDQKICWLLDCYSELLGKKTSSE